MDSLEMVVTGLAGETIVALSGEIDLATAPQVRDCLAALDGDSGTVVVDLSGVTFLDSSGIAMLINTHQEYERTDRQLVLRRPHDRVRRVLEITKVDDLLNIENLTPDPTG